MTRIGEEQQASQQVGQSALQQELIERYGEIMDAAALVALFRFPSDRAFRRAVTKGVLPVTVFRIPGRPGLHARTRDVAGWLEAVVKKPNLI